MSALSNPTNECGCGAIYLVQWYVDIGGFNPNHLAAYVIDHDGTLEKDAVINQAIHSIHDSITKPNDAVEGEAKQKSKGEYDFCDVRGPYAPFHVEGGMLRTRESVFGYLQKHEPEVFKKVKHMVVVASALDG